MKQKKTAECSAELPLTFKQNGDYKTRLQKVDFTVSKSTSVPSRVYGFLEVYLLFASSLSESKLFKWQQASSLTRTHTHTSLFLFISTLCGRQILVTSQTNKQRSTQMLAKISLCDQQKEKFVATVEKLCANFLSFFRSFLSNISSAGPRGQVQRHLLH